MNCEQTRKTILVLDDGPDPDLEDQVNRHLEGCEDCRRFRRQLHQAWEALDGAPVLEPSADFNRRVWQRIEARRESPAAGLWRSIWPVSRMPLAGWAALLVLAMAGGFLAYQVHRQSPPAAVQFTAGDLQDSQMLLELDTLMSVDETEFLNTFQEWDLSRDSAPAEEEAPAASPGQNKPDPVPGSQNMSRLATRAFSA